MSVWEREHIIAAYRFELGKVEHEHVRERTVACLNHIDHELATGVAEGIGVAVPGPAEPNHGRSSPALSMANPALAPGDTISHPRDRCAGRRRRGRCRRCWTG
jgi:catalase